MDAGSVFRNAIKGLFGKQVLSLLSNILSICALFHFNKENFYTETGIFSDFESIIIDKC